MWSSPPEPPGRGLPAHTLRRTFLAAVLAATALLLPALLATPAGAQDSNGPSGGAAAAARTETTLEPDVGPTSACSPGHIVQRPECGVAPASATDPGGWLQVSLFYLIAASVIGILALVWWRSRVARDRRRAAGLDPLTLARASGQGVRRSTRSEPVAETSSKPEANAGR